MAIASPCGRWSWARSAIKPFSSSSSSPCNPLIFVSFQISPRERRRLATFSVQNSSRPDPDAAKSRLRKSKATDLSSSKSIASGDVGDVGEVNLVKLQSPKKRFITFKSLFGKKQLWRRILFASNKVRSLILLNVITVVYASNIPVVKEVEAIMDPAAFTVVRFTVSAIPFIPFVARSWNNTHTRNGGIELGVWVSLGYLMQALGLLTSDAGRASFLSMFTVIMVPLLDGMLGAVVPLYTWFGALVSILGVGMLESSGSPPCVGDLLNFLSAVFFGVHMLRTEHVSRNTNKNEFLSLLGYEICVVALFSTMWYFFGGWFGGAQPSDPSSWTWEMIWNWMVVFPWIPALYSGVFSTGLCLWVEMDAMRDVSATEAAIIYGLEPVWGGAFAWFLLGERWGTTGWIGAALVLGGSLTVQIIGSSSPSKFSKDEESDEEGHNILTTSPVVVSSRKDVDVYRK